MAGVEFVIVSGPPGSGKSTLARPLAEQLRLPLLGKDTIKEAIMDALGVDTVEDSQRSGRAAVACLLALARANGHGVLESVWTAREAITDLLGLGGNIVEVFCDVDAALSRQRYLERADTRHRGHFDRERGADWSLWRGAGLQPLAGGWPVIRVDTSLPVDIDALVHDIVTSERVRP